MNIGIIGMGHLGKATLTGLLRSGTAPENLIVTARTEEAQKALEESYPGVAVTTDNRDAALKADTVIIILRPQDAAGVLGELKDLDLSDKTIISFMAGIRISDIRGMLGDDQSGYRILRMMPNLGISLCKGVIGVSCDEGSNGTVHVPDIFRKLGYLVRLPEDKLENITVCAASGLGFAAYIMKQYTDACCKLFADETVSDEITRRVFETAIDMVRNDNSSFDRLVEQISTRGGTTEAGINVLKGSELGNTMDECFDAALARVRK